MNKFLVSIFVLILFTYKGFSQDIQIVVHEYSLTDTLGAEMIFDFDIINISTAEQTVFEVRTMNQLPANWISSLCFGNNCFPPMIDSIATTDDFYTPSVQPGDTLKTSLHVTSYQQSGTANVQIQIGTFRRPAERTTIDFTGTVNPVGISDHYTVQEYSLEQNYPNPFNPATTISYSVAAPCNVNLTIYDILGNETAVLVNQFQNNGSYEVSFDGSNYPSGIYLYKLSSGNFTAIKKLILLK